MNPSILENFIRGFLAPIRSIALLPDRPKLFALFIAPMLINLVVISVVLYALIAGGYSYLSALLFQFTGNYTGWFAGTVIAFAALTAVYFFTQTLTITIAFFASPFNDLLSEETERALGYTPTSMSFRSMIEVSILDLKKTLIALSVVVGLTLFSFIPVIGLFSFIGFALINAFTFLTYPLNRRKMGILATIHYMQENFFLVFGFGVASTLLFAIPVLNLFALPLSVMGGTCTYLNLKSSK